MSGITQDALKSTLDRLPARPGVYIYRNRAGRPIYIGKAKSLRNRVRSYFRPGARHAPHIARMVSEVADLETIVVDTEMEALILESNLVKRERPRYNVVLRDDKHFPYLKLSLKDAYPRVSLVRRTRVDGNVYVGPFLPAASARRTMKLVQRYFQVATCNEVFDGKRRPCLYYHLDQCLAPCAGNTHPREYGRAVRDARLFLEGRHPELERTLAARMKRASEERDYEKAARYRDTLATVRARAVRQRMTSVGREEQDYLAHHADHERVVLEAFEMRRGRIQRRREFEFDVAGWRPEDFYASVLPQYYAETVPPPVIYLPCRPARGELLQRWLSQRRGGRVRLRVPLRGEKKKLLELVRRNARLALESRHRLHHTHGVEGLDELARLLGLDEPPYRIECFDISNTGGTDAVASMVVWEGGKPRKSDYRIFNIRGVEGPDDVASIGEAVTRRYRRLVGEDRRLPDLVLIDGGAGQLGAAVSALAREGLPTVPVVSIAKREEEIYLQRREAPVRLDRSSPALRLVQRVRDEAHRFAVSRHRRKRSKRTLRTALTDVPGIGPVRARRLLREFGSVEGVRRAAPEALAGLVGERLGRILRERLGRGEPGG